MNLATPRSSAVARPPALRRIFTSSTDTALPQHIESCSPPDSSSSPFDSFEKCLSGDSTEESNSSSSGEPPRRKSSKEEEHHHHQHQHQHHHHIIRKWLAQRKERAAEKTEAMKNVMCSHYEQKYNTVAGLSQTPPKVNGSIPSSV